MYPDPGTSWRRYVTWYLSGLMHGRTLMELRFIFKFTLRSKSYVPPGVPTCYNSPPPSPPLPHPGTVGLAIPGVAVRWSFASPCFKPNLTEIHIEDVLHNISQGVSALCLAVKLFRAPKRDEVILTINTKPEIMWRDYKLHTLGKYTC